MTARESPGAARLKGLEGARRNGTTVREIVDVQPTDPTAPVPMMTESEARACVNAINRHMDTARAMLLDLYEREGWRALGYDSWRACVVVEFEQSQSYLYRQLAAARIEREISPMGETGEEVPELPERRLREIAAAPTELRLELLEQSRQLPFRELSALAREVRSELGERRDKERPVPAIRHESKPAPIADGRPAKATLIVSDVRAALAGLPRESVHVAISSPPYYGLRSYGSPDQVWGGEPDHAHEWTNKRWYAAQGNGMSSAAAFSEPGLSNSARPSAARWHDNNVCDCGAWLGSLGLEPTPDCLAWARSEPPCSSCYVCADEETEVLTDAGWRRHDEVVASDALAQYDMATGELRWGRARTIRRYNVRDEALVDAGSGRLRMLVTANHQAVAVPRGREAAEFVRADLLRQGYRIPTAAPWHESPSGELPCSNELAELLGWYVAEGNRLRRQGRFRTDFHASSIEISQSESANSANVAQLRYLLQATDARFREYVNRSGNGTKVMFRVSGPVAEEIIRLAQDKLPTQTLTWPAESIRAVLRGLLGGDGSIGPGNRVTFIQRSKDLADLVQALFVRIGVSAVAIQVRNPKGNGPVWHVYTQSRRYRTITKLSRTRYSGVVWCPETETHTWVARKDGHVFITGNCHLRTVLAALWPVLRDDGTFWLNLGDSYSGSGKGPTGWSGAGDQTRRQGFDGRPRTISEPSLANGSTTPGRSWVPAPAGIRRKNLLLMPERVALAAQADGWIVRSRIPWGKRSAMPESVTDRPCSAVEYVLLLARSESVFWDADAVRTCDSKGAGTGHNRRNSDWLTESLSGLLLDEDGDALALIVNPAPFPGAHFATFSSKLVEPMIRASTSERGVCPECGAPWERITERVDSGRTQKMADGWDTGGGAHGTIHRNGREAGVAGVPVMVATTTGWRPTCTHGWHASATHEGGGMDPIPATVLDPFAGAGSTLLAAARLGRDSIGIELSRPYADMAVNRIQADGGFTVDVELRELPSSLSETTPSS